jgi:glycosyltransferase involved in cell wall biosynthesis
VTYLGHISNDQELFKYWNNAQVYFHGHTVGGTNPALVQAMHCGARILARETIYNREVLGDAGYYFDPDLPSLYQKLQYLLLSKETSRDIRDMARIRAKDLYSWEEISYEYLSLLQSS